MKNKIKWLIIFSLPFICFIFSLKLGRYTLSVKDIFEVLWSHILIRESNMEIAETIIYNIRLPRVLSSMLIGASISVAGAVYQSLFKNPMVSPSILGASSGAAFGAALGILCSFSIFMIQALSFTLGILAVLIAYLISIKMKIGNNTLCLILSGMLINTVFTSLISLIKYVADPTDKLPAITFWLMGSFSSVEMRDFYIVCITTVIGIVPLLLLRWKISVISFGEEEARSMGININIFRAIIIVCSTLMTASAVSVCGLISWVGLVIPHLVRMLVGSDYKKLLPLCMVFGSCYLLMVDNISRVVFPVEIPLGILTSLIGAPFFIYLMIRGKRAW